MEPSRSGPGSFRENRRRLAMSLPPGTLAVIATGHPVPCGPDSAAPWPDFYYLTGRREPHSALIIEAHREGAGRTVLFTPARDDLWDGPSNPDDIADVRPWPEFEPVLRALAFQSTGLCVHS
ncbi:MAG TPA: aminopeptidase P N-terminal domain-containing protein, partial [Verrucomicrobiales bacterium]|nr:aminopeptidase P N-terminal domain-containing protein [Verrucomicrobiales bacterium]